MQIDNFRGSGWIIRKFTVNRKIIEHSCNVHYYVRRTWICVCTYTFIYVNFLKLWAL